MVGKKDAMGCYIFIADVFHEGDNYRKRLFYSF